MSLSVYYFQYKQVSGREGIVGRLSETEIVNLLPRVIEVATPEIYPPGSIVWYASELTSEEIERCSVDDLSDANRHCSSWEDTAANQDQQDSGDSTAGLRCLLRLR